MVGTTYEPAWARFEKDLSNPDPKIASQAAVAFDETRKEEMKKDSKARKWEQDRKAAFLKDKPEFTRQRIKKEKEEYDKTLNKYLNGGIVMGKFVPAPGFLLVKPIEQELVKNGIFLPAGIDTTDVGEPNKGIVIAVGKEKHYTGGLVLDAPCKEGDTVMYKWHTMQILYDGKKHNFMSFEDVFGVLE